MDRLPQRKHPAHGVKVIPAQATIVLVTVCTLQRQPWTACNQVHHLLREVWSEATGWRVGYYLIMPDHTHFFVTTGEMDIALERWMHYWKSQFSNRYLQPLCKWQSDHWDTRIRSTEHYHDRLNYVRNNPVRKGLVADAELWPYQGTIYHFGWES